MKNLNFKKLDNTTWLIPAIIQDFDTKQVLMLWFMNEEAYKKTLETEKVTFFSRTKNRLWTKWEKSWNFLNVLEIKEDCDEDTILIYVKPQWNTCHKWSFSCFWEKENNINFLTELYKIILDRKENPQKDSYTSSLFEKWINKIAQKVWEEWVETVIAWINETKKDLIYESSDLIYHLLILLVERGVSLDDLILELKKRR